MNTERGRGQNRVLLYASLPLVLGVATASFAILGSSLSNDTPPPLNPTSSENRHFPLEISPDPIDLDVVHEGEGIERPLSLRNTRDDALTLERVETSCACVRVSPIPVEVGPRQTKVLSVGFNSSSDPDFEGKLSVHLTGYLSGGEIAFRTEVRLRSEDEQ